MEFIKTNNYTKGRNGYQPKGIVIHIQEGTQEGTIQWFKNPKSQASAHFLVGKNGHIIQMVNTEDTAWHCGVVSHPKWQHIIQGVNPNFYTIGIEFEGTTKDNPTLTQMLSGAQLILVISKKWSIPLNRDFIIPHREIDDQKTCPGYNLGIETLIGMAFELSKIY